MIFASTIAQVRGGPSPGVFFVWHSGPLEMPNFLVLPGLDAADAQVAALGQAEGVVERDLDRALARPPRSAPVSTTARRAGDERRRRRLRGGGSSADRPRRAVVPRGSRARLLLGGEDVRAVGRGLLGGARAALVLAGAGVAREQLLALVERRRCPASAPVDVERVEDGLRARPAAERVVAAGVREVVEPAEQVGRVGAAVGDDRRGVAQRLGRSRGTRRACGRRPAAPPPASTVRFFVSSAVEASGGKVRTRSYRSLSRAGRAGRSRSGRGRSGRASRASGRSSSQERLELARDRLRRLDQRVDVVEREAQVHERRVGLAHEVRAGALIASASASRSLPSARKVRVQVADQRRQVVAALGQRGDELGRVDDEALEQSGCRALSSLNSRLEVDSAGFR